MVLYIFMFWSENVVKRCVRKNQLHMTSLYKSHNVGIIHYICGECNKCQRIFLEVSIEIAAELTLCAFKW